jgi:hypothetical protein
MTEINLEKKINNIKNKLESDFKNKELEQGKYWDTVDQYLRDENITPSNGKKYSNTKLSLEICCKLENKLQLKTFRGIQNNYITKSEENLQENAKKDINQFIILKENSKNYLKSEFESYSVHEKEFDFKLEKYINSQDITKKNSEIKNFQIFYTIKEKISANYNFIKEVKKPEFLGKYDVNDIINLIDKD